MTHLELLAPARNMEIGIAAIDCGADAVYIAGPEFGARAAAGNSVEDIARLCEYAHRFGARVFVTLNTILYDDELSRARELMLSVQKAGADALIVQDLAVLALTKVLDNAELDSGATDSSSQGPSIASLKIPLHASTQCAIRTPETARLYEGLGFSRLVLERELSLEQIRAIREAVSCEIEFFVHGALCVCYSGQCYLSEAISGRSANRGCCIQACRANYDLVDGTGRTLVKNKALLSLKDYNLKARLWDLAEAGVCSFKIEGRLKGLSYVKNVVREYSLALDELCAKEPSRYARASFGRVTGGFTPDPSKTFNRGYTELFLDGHRGQWASMDIPKSIGEEVGTVLSVRHIGRDEMEVKVDFSDRLTLSNGDGFSFATPQGVDGFRGDVCQGNTIRCKAVRSLRPGLRLYRNISADFEKTLVQNPCRRLIGVKVSAEITFIDSTASRFNIHLKATSEDGRQAELDISQSFPLANDPERMRALWQSQISKQTAHYAFTLSDPPHVILSDPSLRHCEPPRVILSDPSLRHCEAPQGPWQSPSDQSEHFPSRHSERSEESPFLRASELNDFRRRLADLLDAQPCHSIPMRQGSTEIATSGSALLAMTDAASHLAMTDAASHLAMTESHSSRHCEAPQGPWQSPFGHTEHTPPVILSDPPHVILSEAKNLTGCHVGQEERSEESVLNYKFNISNHLSEQVYRTLGADSIDPAYELSHPRGAELMRTKYCIRHELGLCPKQIATSGSALLAMTDAASLLAMTNATSLPPMTENHSSRHCEAPQGPWQSPFGHSERFPSRHSERSEESKELYLLNNGRRLRLTFDCAHCEMIVSEATR